MTLDGVPHNDTGNYAVYSNQLLGPQLVEQINVNLGATNADSPTASAAGGSVTFRSLIPGDRPDRLADRFGIVGVGLAALDVGLNVGRRH